MLEFFGIEYKLELNSLGCTTCMPPYKESLINFLENEDDICDDCKRRRDTNPIRVLDCKNQSCQEIYQNAPLLLDNLCSACNDEFEQLKEILDKFDVKYTINPKLVRGLDYYNKTAFEFVSDSIGAQSAIAGGGRYDKLVEYLDGKPTTGIGFAMGIERLMELIVMPELRREGYYIGALCDEAQDICFKLAIRMRKSKITSLNYDKKSLKAHLKNADKQNAKYCVCIGEDELSADMVWVKDLETKNEECITKEELLGR
jgi:histidyl-tRNA synthetase